MTFPKIVLLSTCVLFSLACPAAQPIISEFMADNDTVLADEDGDYEDWVEIYNPGPGAIDLEGYHLTDDLDEPQKWRFPTQVIPAGGYVVVFASGKDRDTPGFPLHTGFKLDAGGEPLALVAPDGVTVLSSFGAGYPEQYPDISYGFQTQGANPTLRTGLPGYLISHTPGAANTVIPGPHPLYCDTSLARIEITASQSVWDGLHAGTPTSTEGSVNIRFRHGDIDVTVNNVGIRARGNTGLTKHPRSFRVSFNSFVPGQDLFGIEKLNLNSEANDPSTARSKLCFDLAQAAGLPSEYANHVATVIIGPDNHRSPGPDGVFFDAVLNNTQPVDDVFVKQRFANTRGNLYKSVWPFELSYQGPTGSSYMSRFELKYQGGADGSFNDLAEFIDIINNTSTQDFPSVIRKYFEVDDFLKRLALDVLTSNWDGYWGNRNNAYLYRDPASGRWQYIPFDMDNTFSIRWITPSSGDWATQNMYNWGQTENVPLITRILNVPEFQRRYSYYMNQMVQTFYQNSALNPLVYRIRDNQTAALPFGGLGISNCKFTDRDRYDGDWPNWTYTQYYNSFDDGQVSANGSVPNHHGITEFITLRRANTLNQLNLQNIGPIISDFAVAPSLPATNEPIVVSARIYDDVQVTSVTLNHSFNGGANTAVAMADNGTGADAAAGDGIYTAQVGPFPTAGTLTCYLNAVDNQSKSTFEPWGGASDAASVPIGSPYLSLAVTELQYHPHAPTGSELGVSADADDYEFVELQNLGSSSLNLAGVEFIAGISYIFPSETLAPGERVVIVRNEAAFVARYGAGHNVSGEYSGQLSNGGEQLHVISPTGATLHDFSYADTAPWPMRADGRGSSLELLDPSGDYSDPLNWRPSIDYGGSPDAAGTNLAPGIVINEVLTHTDPPLVDSIELHNRSEAAIDIGGWFLSDTDQPYRKYRIPNGTVLAAGAYLTFDETNHFNTSMGANTNTDFALDGAHGDDVWLLQGDVHSNLVAFVDHVEFGAARNGESFGRWPNGQGAMVPMLVRTFNSSNTAARVGPVVVGEFMYAPYPADPNLEFIELYNGGLTTEILDNWKIVGGVDFAFPSNTFLLPGAVLTVLPFDPGLPGNATLLNAFRAHYGMDANAALTGPFLGSLADSGDTIRLQRPDAPPAEEPTFTPLLLEDEVTFQSTLPWPVEAAGTGSSLMRIGPTAWGNDPQSWTIAPHQLATPGASPLADGDGDHLPDIYEIETYGSTNVVGMAGGGDTDGDGSDDESEYVAGTSATNAGSRFEITVNPGPGGIVVEFETEPLTGPGYFGLVRRYDLEQTGDVGVPGSWAGIPDYTNLPALGGLVTYTNTATNSMWTVRGRVSLQSP